ncbi:hypothetical protein LOY67_11740 [Pseudomonas sp. B21-056]|uniref:hypothetical protein n=1 Tax=Pseudomonas sp. B21-056 TaxID=2895495 RepID=UPI002230274F|nr:hypothetical protein [Pseudomonas sp. B21-056]UZE26036.1 hypothetical protein LOY67_11740 [Pseudomonas sp. B21-056]
MFRHTYTCNICHSNVIIDHTGAMNPLTGRLVTHRDIQLGDPEPGMPKISTILQGKNDRCYGSLIHKNMEPLAPAAPAAPRAVTSQSVCLEFCGGQQHATTNTISAAVDITDPASRKKKGVNAHGKTLAALHDTLKRLLGNSDRLEGWSITNCAEVDAVDKLLWDGIQPTNIRVSTCDRGGRIKPPCENCQSWLTMVVPGVYKIR